MCVLHTRDKCVCAYLTVTNTHREGGTNKAEVMKNIQPRQIPNNLGNRIEEDVDGNILRKTKWWRVRTESKTTKKPRKHSF